MGVDNEAVVVQRVGWVMVATINMPEAVMR